MAKKTAGTGAPESGSSSQATAERIPAAQRRELILEAATGVFAERGYAGSTTDQVAKAAGISQPYVVRMFGTKETLFLEALDRAQGKLLRAFRDVIAAYDAGELAEELRHLDPAAGSGRPEQLKQLMAIAYADLIEDRGILMMLMQAFVAGHEPAIGARAREGFLDIYRLVRDEAGLSPETSRDFLAQGMLMNTLIGIRLPEVYEQDETAEELLECTLRSKLPMVLKASKAQRRAG
ncbi:MULTISPECIES: TetR/AcrR family transcriptional regulator [Arthrobacter]|uniref:AcrR family transcriptional regulator n=1 Tax=Arthrobacter bambusae TaxID=1338426 RepID=A0AAW8DID7_9MICC|nr:MULTISPECIES: TetR/AcrR family transcriptional regulator [Arthrobacter]MDP9906225.1 AcrR family transcriptional regulator [Arthrobacter bambusae]MDQ0130542.1 AcrR family transcriptional regulator [Arthrobacter bambusae]MDQ0182217.1 AcrR family transcriptional regulator [Arthrobacter bambusae]